MRCGDKAPQAPPYMWLWHPIHGRQAWGARLKDGRLRIMGDKRWHPASRGPMVEVSGLLGFFGARLALGRARHTGYKSIFGQ